MKIKAFGYVVVAPRELIDEIQRSVNDSRYLGSCINWFNFKTGDTYYDDNGAPYDVVIDHESKTVALVD